MNVEFLLLLRKLLPQQTSLSVVNLFFVWPISADVYLRTFYHALESIFLPFDVALVLHLEYRAVVCSLLVARLLKHNIALFMAISRGGTVHEKRLSRCVSCVRRTVRRMRNAAPSSHSFASDSFGRTYI